MADALDEARVVAVLGPRQSGKSTLVGEIAAVRDSMGVVTLDDEAMLNQARDDPKGFLADRGVPLVIDEIQRAPNLMLAIKQRVDADNDRGQYLITGSANLIRMRSVPDALPGRVDYLRLWPLSQGEIGGVREDFVDQVFAGDVPSVREAPVGVGAYAERIVAGGYPEVIGRSSGGRERWFAGYVDSAMPTVLADVTGADPAITARVLHAVAVRSSSLAARASIAREVGVSDKTVDAHVEALAQLMLVRRLQPWFTNLVKRQVKSPKVIVTDSGLWATLVGADRDRLINDPALAGQALETFVAMELVKQLEWSTTRATLHHYRDSDKREIDLILESRDGRVVAIEVKASATPRPRDTNHLRWLRDKLGERFVSGILLHAGSETHAFGDRISAVPISGLWAGASE